MSLMRSVPQWDAGLMRGGDSGQIYRPLTENEPPAMARCAVFGYLPKHGDAPFCRLRRQSGMTGVETRSVARDSLFLLADVRVEQSAEIHRVRVRNLSDGGMMGESNLRVQRGNRLTIELRNIGAVSGTVAWVQDNRFGVAFDEEIDSQKARRPSQAPEDPAVAVVRPSWAHRAPPPPHPARLRKI
jgi:hypothetical protein